MMGRQQLSRQTMEERSEKSHMLKSAGVVGGFTLLSRTLGLFRDILMGSFFGTSLAMSSFVIAFMIPNLFRRLFGEGALSAAFVPVFITARNRDGEAAAWAMAHKVFSLLAAVLSVIAVAGVAVSTLVLVSAEPGTMLAAVFGLLRIMLPYMVFICLVALCMAILNSFHHFAVPAATSVVLNLIWIGTLLFLCPHLGETLMDKVKVVAWAILVAGVAQLLVQVPVMRRHGYRFRLTFDWRDERVRRVVILMGPAALGLAVAQINVIIDKTLAAWVGQWAPSALYYSERLIYFPLGIFATALSTVLLPVYSRQASNLDHEALMRTMRGALGHILFVMLPATVGLLVLATPIVSMAFERGEFDAFSRVQTALALQFYAPGLVVFGLAKVFVPAFYGRQDTRTPVLVGLGSVGLNLVMNLLAVWTWQDGMEHAGLALATVLSSTFNALVLAYLVHHRMGSPGWGRILKRMGRCVVISGVMGAAVHGFYATAFPVLLSRMGGGSLTLMVATLASVVVGVVIYLALSAFCRAPELHAILSAISRKRSAPAAS